MRPLSGFRGAGILLAAGTSLGVVAAVRRRRVSNRVRDLRADLRTRRRPVTATPYDPDDSAELPVPVRRYFDTVLTGGQGHVSGARLAQEGSFRLGGAEASWYPFTAGQTYTVSPPGYVWDATIELAPAVSVRVFDAYVGGEGRLRANLFGAIPVASAGPDPRTNEAQLKRYLSETPWFPTALLPAGGVTWKGIDDRSAQATIEDGETTATAVFHFDESGYITRIRADRYRQDTGETEPWIGRYRAYETHHGMAIPTEAEVAWETADGEVPYWRGTITGIRYRGIE